MTTKQTAGLEERLTKLEGQNRRLRTLMVGLTLLAGAALVAGAVDDLAGQQIRPSSVDTARLKADRIESDRIEADEIRVRSLNVSGISLGELRLGGTGRHALLTREGLRLFDRSGTERLRLVIPEEFDTPILEVLDEDGETRQIALGCWDEEGEGFCGLSILDLGGESVLEVALPIELLSDYLPPEQKQERPKRVIIRR